MNFFNELKRRNVIKVAAAYIIVGWLIMQAGEVMGPALHLPAWVNSTLAFFLILGFPLAMLFAWAYEMTPEGLKKERDIDRDESITNLTGRKLDFTIIFMLVLALVYFVYERSANTVPVRPVANNIDATEATDKLAIQPSIAVLPFADMSPQGDQAYFSDGIAEELLNLLVRVDGLKVASRTSSFSYKGDNLNLSEIADELKVAHILEGSVRKAGNRVRITAQLIDTATDRHLWSESYDRDLTDIFAIQDNIANAIVDALRAELGLLDSVPEIVVKADTKNLDAYQLYLEARSLFINRKDLGHSIELFSQAIGLDENFARAWEGLGAVLSVAEGWGIVGENFDERAREASQKAIELDPSLSLAWATLAGTTIGLNSDFTLGMSQFNQAIENDPMSSTALFWRGLTYARLGFTGESIKDISKCIEIDPAYLNCYRHLARVYLNNGEIDKSLQTYFTNVRGGVSINDFWLIYPLLERDKKFAASFLLIVEARRDRDYPYKELMNAVQNPEDNHAPGITKLVSWSQRQGIPEKFRLTEWIALGAYDKVDPGADAHQLWAPSAAGFRASPYFKPLAKKAGWSTYWRENGYPPQCRPIGKEDFECD